MPHLVRRLAQAGLVAVAATTMFTATPAMAAGRDGTCDSGEFCLFFNSNQGGSLSDFTGSISDYGATQPSCYEFKSAGLGKGQCVKNHAASVWNRTSKPVTVFFNSGYDGAEQTFAAGARGNLNSTLKNDNAGHQIGNSRTNMSYALYEKSGGSITCGFDGYTSTNGRHEGIDIARSIGSSVHALVSGKVTSVVRGSTGRAGLSTIAVYNATLNKTVIYLHSAPLAKLAVGQTISKGEVIATESWRGVSYSSSAHTHVEMRPGKQTRASKSVDDKTLDNPNPTSFWHDRGYNVK